MQVPILSGIKSDANADFRAAYPRNLVPVPQGQGISAGYLRPAPGIVQMGAGPGIGRGGIQWRGVLYRVLGTKLCRVSSAGTITELGDVGAGGQCSFDYGFDRLAITSGGRLYYWTGVDLVQVTDEDLGTALDVVWIAGYYMTTDGEFLVVTDLDNPLAVNPLKYGSSEVDPDPVLAVDKLRNEAYAFNRHTIEAFDNIGGTGFPFQRIDGAQVPRGIMGTHAYCHFLSTFAFVGSGRNEAPAVYLMTAGDTQKLSTREIDQTLAGYTEAQLAQCIVESRVHDGHQHLLIHLPDQCLVYDHTMTQAAGDAVWFTLASGTEPGTIYRGRSHVWAYDDWHVEDPLSPAIGRLSDAVSTHYGQPVGWEFCTLMLYNEGRRAIVHAVELSALTGRIALGADPVVWTSYTLDGVTWSQEQPCRAGKQGERGQRLQWRKQGGLVNFRAQKFRGNSDAHLSFARLEMTLEPLNG